MKNYLFLLTFLFAAGSFGADSYPELMDQAEKLLNQRYTQGSRAYTIKSGELDDILKQKDSKKKDERLKSLLRNSRTRKSDKNRSSIRSASDG